MKIAHLDLYFRLPDDYVGDDLIKLLTLIIDYKVQNKNKSSEKSHVAEELKNSKTISKYGYDVLTYNRFMQLSREKGFKLSGEVRFIDAKSDRID
jgi:hypothetical protein